MEPRIFSSSPYNERAHRGHRVDYSVLVCINLFSKTLIKTEHKFTVTSDNNNFSITLQMRMNCSKVSSTTL